MPVILLGNGDMQFYSVHAICTWSTPAMYLESSLLVKAMCIGTIIITTGPPGYCVQSMSQAKGKANPPPNTHDTDQPSLITAPEPLRQPR